MHLGTQSPTDCIIRLLTSVTTHRLCVSSWSIVKVWLDPRTQAKIEILGSTSLIQRKLLVLAHSVNPGSGPDTLNKIAEVIHRDTIPVSMGGRGPNVFSKKPNCEYLTVPRSGSITRLHTTYFDIYLHSTYLTM